jgi:hypothetical protein
MRLKVLSNISLLHISFVSHERSVLPAHRQCTYVASRFTADQTVVIIVVRFQVYAADNKFIPAVQSFPAHSYIQLRISQTWNEAELLIYSNGTRLSNSILSSDLQSSTGLITSTIGGYKYNIL